MPLHKWIPKSISFNELLTNKGNKCPQSRSHSQTQEQTQWPPPPTPPPPQPPKNRVPSWKGSTPSPSPRRRRSNVCPRCRRRCPPWLPPTDGRRRACRCLWGRWRGEAGIPASSPASVVTTSSAAATSKFVCPTSMRFCDLRNGLTFSMPIWSFLGAGLSVVSWFLEEMRLFHLAGFLILWGYLVDFENYGYFAFGSTKPILNLDEWAFARISEKRGVCWFGRKLLDRSSYIEEIFFWVVGRYSRIIRHPCACFFLSTQGVLLLSSTRSPWKCCTLRAVWKQCWETPVFSGDFYQSLLDLLWPLPDWEFDLWRELFGPFLFVSQPHGYSSPVSPGGKLFFFLFLVYGCTFVNIPLVFKYRKFIFLGLKFSLVLYHND